MNKYIKVKVEFCEAKDRLNRTLWIKEGTSLGLLGRIIVTTMHGAFTHLYGFHDKTNNISYTDKEQIEETGGIGYQGLKYCDMDKTYVGKTNPVLCFTYDYGDGWTFDITFSKEIKDIDSKESAILIEGKGQGIWEDNIVSLYEYLSGKIDPKDTKDHMDKGIVLPYNFKNKCYGDFDKPLNIKKENEYLSKHIKTKK